MSSTMTAVWARQWFDENLACPYDRTLLAPGAGELICPQGHAFPVVHGVPVLIRSDKRPTHALWQTTPEDVARHLAISLAPPPEGTIDPFVEGSLVATCGGLYRGRKALLVRYPIPEMPLPPGEGRVLLDVGSNWGRWALAASRNGYRAIAIDPSLEAALAGVRVAKQLNLPVAYVVGDARHLPFQSNTVDVAFSYSVLQHLEKATVKEVVTEIARVTREGGAVRVQMANVLGARQLFNHAQSKIVDLLGRLRRKRPPPYSFRVRAWSPKEIVDVFTTLVGPAKISADSFFSLNAQASDLDILGTSRGLVVRASELLRRVADRLPGAAYLADSVFVDAVNRKGITVPAS